MSKFKLYLLYVCTFGIAYFYLKNKAKQIAHVENEELTLSDEIKINVDQLISALGTISNITNCDHTISAVKVYVKDLSIVNVDGIKKLGVKGVMKGKDYISFIVGDYSHLLKEKIIKLIEA
ncbi:MAG: hypothetical protein ACRCVI_03205 [Mycoplasmoidaceae bacterium]